MRMLYKFLFQTTKLVYKVILDGISLLLYSDMTNFDGDTLISGVHHQMRIPWSDVVACVFQQPSELSQRMFYTLARSNQAQQVCVGRDQPNCESKEGPSSTALAGKRSRRGITENRLKSEVVDVWLLGAKQTAALLNCKPKKTTMMVRGQV